MKYRLVIFMGKSRNGGLRYIRIKPRLELSGYELIEADCILTKLVFQIFNFGEIAANGIPQFSWYKE